MTPATIIQQAAAEGVSLALSPAGTIKAIGDQVTVNRWLPVIRENKPGIVAALQQAANDDTLPDPTMEARRQRVLAMLAERPGIRYAVVVDNPNTDPVLVSIGIRDVATFDLAIPKAKYDQFLLLDLIERHGATVH